MLDHESGTYYTPLLTCTNLWRTRPCSTSRSLRTCIPEPEKTQA